MSKNASKQQMYDDIKLANKDPPPQPQLYVSADSPSIATATIRAQHELESEVLNFETLVNQLVLHQQIAHTSNDSPANHHQIRKLIDSGRLHSDRILKLFSTTTTLNNHLKSQYEVLVSRYKQNVALYVTNEREAVDFIRRSSSQTLSPLAEKSKIEQLEEVDNYPNLMKREKDLQHIHSQLTIVLQTYQDVNRILSSQGEKAQLLKMQTQKAAENAQFALSEAEKANKSKRYCHFTKAQLICYGLLLFVTCIFAASIALAI